MFDRLRTRLEAGRQDGFTLIELLIVIIILGVLAAIVVFAVGGITDRGTVSACKQDKKTMETAVEAYYANTTPAAYPASLTVLTSGNKYLRADSSITSTTQTGKGYVITYDGSGGVSSNLSGC